MRSEYSLISTTFAALHQSMYSQADSASAEVKKKAPPEVLKEVGPLMKLYQEEVDKVSVRYGAGNCRMHKCMDFDCTTQQPAHDGMLQGMCSDPLLAAIRTDLHGRSKTPRHVMQLLRMSGFIMLHMLQEALQCTALSPFGLCIGRNLESRPSWTSTRSSLKRQTPLLCWPWG